jgi:excisionase family DNA binding protein
MCASDRWNNDEHGRSQVEPLLCSIPDAATALGLGRSKVYELICEGHLQTVSIGRRRLVRVASVREFASTLSA